MVAAPMERPSYSELLQHLNSPVTQVSERMAGGDTMFAGRERHYRHVGQSAWRCIASAMLAGGLEEPRTVLDMPCGHGRVLRVLRRAMPHAEFTACDLDRDGVDFCHAEFGATPVYSEVDLNRVVFATPFDLIWCGSLLTHLDAAGWLATFRLVIRSLRPGGIAVVTFHGRWAEYLLRTGNPYSLSRDQTEALLDSHAKTGFGYVDYQGQSGYGISLSSPAWVLAAIAPWPELRVVALAERQWDDHQDVIAVQRL